MTGISSIDGVYEVTAPIGTPAPVVLDSPHSGSVYPANFAAVASHERLRAGEDYAVDTLFPGPEYGATRLAALFPRTYIDPNRALEDLDPDLVAGPWPEPLAPGAKSTLGKGLVWRSCLDGTPIYDRKLTVAEVMTRIERCWRPYRQALAALLDESHAARGGVWHVNCHSMPSRWPAGVEGAGTPVVTDFVVGDRDGTTCAPAFTELVTETLREQGHTVAVNDRFKGVDIVRSHGRPAENRHSIQVEVVRNRYMDEARFERGPGFEAIQAALGRLVERIVEFAGAS